ncbi:hypothetical protein SmJEL517_g02213 [Synchytrium microbalum]|uniref:Uncharacterized protein n=1 Tax=Synchytrium microbalum TaxID=1806994 RepID=A0A507C2E8_9FUNG|nr:uncharacterized protein SmJEL517_g02213 [Synchytrium microbalum]TPX35297.1 hypothetical protein SmJEL517_g02213 [Synchytrium microbalum]
MHHDVPRRIFVVLNDLRVAFVSLVLTSVIFWKLYHLAEYDVSGNAKGADIKPDTVSNRWKNDLPWDEGADQLFTFVQVTLFGQFYGISDLHLSKFRTHSTATFNQFVSVILPRIAPAFVVVTGDLTDAKDQHLLGSEQYREEWLSYHDTLAKNHILASPNFWWDMRGNHDCFNVEDTETSMYNTWGVVKTEGWLFDYSTDFGRYKFIALDACPYGSARPFNFFGTLTRSDLDFLEQSLSDHRSSNHTFILSHYPTSTTWSGLSSSGRTFATLASEASIYLCGHLHKFVADLFPDMYTLHAAGFLELELGDMKHNDLFRIIAVDHDLVSFVDAQIYVDMAPILVITNPRDSRFAIPGREPSHRISTSTHIRILAYGENVKQVSVTIDDTMEIECKCSSSGKAIEVGSNYLPLWTCPWKPDDFNDNAVHRIEATAVDGQNRVGTSSKHMFRVDGQRTAYAWTGTFLLQTPFPVVDPVFFGLHYSSYRYPGSKIFRMEARRHSSLRDLETRAIVCIDRSGWHSDTWEFNRFTALWIQVATERTVVQNVSATYYNHLYMLIGPWFVGELIPNAVNIYERWGAFFIVGLRSFAGRSVSITDTYAYAFFNLTFTFFPLMLCLVCFSTDPDLLYCRANSRRSRPIRNRWYVKLVIGMYIFWAIYSVYLLSYSYGWWSFVLSHKTWYLVVIARCLMTETDLNHATSNGESIKIKLRPRTRTQKEKS